jgi:hypothetical protein
LKIKTTEYHLQLIYSLTCSQGYFCDGRSREAVPEALSQNAASQNGIPELFPGIGFTRFGMFCYPSTLLSKKLAYFVQFLHLNVWSLCILEPISLEK